ncbi:hypothetical protein TNCV_1287601 [Trichonephila clavipes]|nr:hypothetical protein TNCV_1287601 [Trichonephila clavipes]
MSSRSCATARRSFSVLMTEAWEQISQALCARSYQIACGKTAPKLVLNYRSQLVEQLLIRLNDELSIGYFPSFQQ